MKRGGPRAAWRLGDALAAALGGLDSRPAPEAEPGGRGGYSRTSGCGGPSRVDAILRLGSPANARRRLDVAEEAPIP